MGLRTVSCNFFICFDSDVWLLPFVLLLLLLLLLVLSMEEEDSRRLEKLVLEPLLLSLAP